MSSSDVTHDPDPDRELSSVLVSTAVSGSIDIRISALCLYPLSDAIMCYLPFSLTCSHKWGNEKGG